MVKAKLKINDKLKLLSGFLQDQTTHVNAVQD